MMKTQFGLGVLSIPAVLNTLGLIPGVICVCIIAVITTWSNYMIGVFKLRHREVYNIDDAGALMFGRVGRELFGVIICICTPFKTSLAFPFSFFANLITNNLQTGYFAQGQAWLVPQSD